MCAGETFTLNNEEIASITSSLFLGELVGSFFWGPFADIYGRKYAYIYSGLSITVGSILMVGAPNYFVLLFCTIFIGFGIGGCSAAFDLLAEFMPASERGGFLLYIEYFWTLGSLLVIFEAWVVLDMYSWRVLTFIAALPVAIACFCSLFYLDESPRWLLEQGRDGEAHAILLSAASLNGVDLGEFKLVECVEESSDSLTPGSADVLSESSAHVESQASNMSCIGMLKSYAQLLEPDMLSITIPLLAVWFFSAIGYYGIILFTTRINSSEQDSVSSGAQKCTFEYFGIAENCIAELVGVTLCILLINRIGRVSTQFNGYGVGAIAACTMGIFYRNTGILVICAFLARAACMGSMSSTWVGTAEILPTRVRASGHSMCVGVSRIGAFIAPFIVFSSFSEEFVALFVASTCAACMAAVYKLPETLNTSLDSVDTHSNNEHKSSAGGHAYQSVNADVELIPHDRSGDAVGGSSDE